MKIPDLFYPECKQSLRLIMKVKVKQKLTFSVHHASVDQSFGSKKKKKARMGSKKHISTESREEKLNAAA